MTCDEEFGLYLIANPTYVAYGTEPNNPANDNRYFRCSNFEERRYYVPIIVPDCDLAIAEFFLENPQFMEVTVLSAQIAPNRFREFVCPGGSEIRLYGYTSIAAYEFFISILREDSDLSGLTDVGVNYLELERLPSETADQFYARLSTQTFGFRRVFVADGTYYVYVRKDSSYYVLLTPPMLVSLPG
jgi:hypothetical protein